MLVIDRDRDRDALDHERDPDRNDVQDLQWRGRGTRPCPGVGVGDGGEHLGGPLDARVGMQRERVPGEEAQLLNGRRRARQIPVEDADHLVAVEGQVVGRDVVVTPSSARGRATSATGRDDRSR
jgi:hypothetical protein